MYISNTFIKFVLTLCINIYFLALWFGILLFSFGLSPLCYWHDVYHCNQDPEATMCGFGYSLGLLNIFYLWLEVSMFLFFATSIYWVAYKKLLNEVNIVIVATLYGFAIFLVGIGYLSGCYD